MFEFLRRIFIAPKVKSPKDGLSAQTPPTNAQPKTQAVTTKGNKRTPKVEDSGSSDDELEPDANSTKKKNLNEFEARKKRPSEYKFYVDVPERASGWCICGCRGKKWTWERRDEINDKKYYNCPARAARKANEQRSLLLKKRRKLQSWYNREINNLSPRSAEEAKFRYLNFFDGKKCGVCGSTRKTMRYQCAFCRKEKEVRRDAMRRGAYPEDLTPKERREIIAIYDRSRELSIQTGIEHHVDHIKPLAKGGRHHPDNLQILTAAENLKKGAKWEEQT